MHYKTNLKFKIISIICVIVILWSAIFITDYIMISNYKDPIFCVKIQAYKDGGSLELYGIFYKVNKYVYLEEDVKEYEIGFWNMEFLKPDLNNNPFTTPYSEQKH